MKRTKCFDLTVPKCAFRRIYDGIAYCAKLPTPLPKYCYITDAEGIYSVKTPYCEAEHFKGADD